MTDDGAVPPGEKTMIRSEEQFQVTTATQVVGRVRVHKVVVTEERTITVQVQREELRVDEVRMEPADGPGMDSYSLGSVDPVELVLSEQRPVVTFETVPVERVRVGTTVVHEEESVSVELAREEIELHRTT